MPPPLFLYAVLWRCAGCLGIQWKAAFARPDRPVVRVHVSRRSVWPVVRFAHNLMRGGYILPYMMIVNTDKVTIVYHIANIDEQYVLILTHPLL